MRTTFPQVAVNLRPKIQLISSASTLPKPYKVFLYTVTSVKITYTSHILGCELKSTRVNRPMSSFASLPDEELVAGADPASLRANANHIHRCWRWGMLGLVKQTLKAPTQN